MRQVSICRLRLFEINYVPRSLAAIYPIISHEPRNFRINIRLAHWLRIVYPILYGTWCLRKQAAEVTERRPQVDQNEPQFFCFDILFSTRTHE